VLFSRPDDAGGPKGPRLRPGVDRGPKGPVLRVGVIGTGRIGLALVGHIARSGFAVTAYDADPAKRPDVESRGATWADLPDLARGVDAVLIVVGYDRDLRTLVANGLIETLRPGTILAVLSTVEPRTVQELATKAAAAGIHVVDATMCRGGRAADAGTMLSFVAGDPADVERLRPVISAYSSDIVYTGAIGTAQAAKAANNLLMWACLIANHEALALAGRFGVDVDVLREALLKTGAENGVLRHWGTSTMAWADDDLEIIQSMACEVGVELRQADLNRELCRQLKPNKFRLDTYGRRVLPDPP
jgi:3-hydroxyisobutyrate dehydrogenase-like beta-hydroxyacid dehydrogenase